MIFIAKIRIGQQWRRCRAHWTVEGGFWAPTGLREGPMGPTPTFVLIEGNKDPFLHHLAPIPFVSQLSCLRSQNPIDQMFPRNNLTLNWTHTLTNITNKCRNTEGALISSYIDVCFFFSLLDKYFLILSKLNFNWNQI